MSKRKVCVITGTRAEYSLLKPVMKELKKSRDLKLQTIVTGMHLLPEFGMTCKEIEKDGFRIHAKIPLVLGGDTKQAMTVSIGVGIIEITQSLNMLNPDIVLILGDRSETLSAAISASYSGIVVAHLHGGDNPEAGYDEYSRHAITKMSHLHFPTTKNSAERIKKLGENTEYIFTIGSTSLDTIANMKFKSKQSVFRKYDIDVNKPTALVVQHPLSTHPKSAKEEILITLESIVDLGLQSIIILPNVDPGGIEIANTLTDYCKKHEELFHIFKSLPVEEYLNIMNCVDVMVGNSSSGIIESPAFKLPVINIGTRQKGRDRGGNVIDVEHDKKAIINAANKALDDKNFKKKVQNVKNPYGDSGASKRIVKVLSKIQINEKLLIKKITY